MIKVKVINTEVLKDWAEVVDIFGQGCNYPTKKGVEGLDVTFEVEATAGKESKKFNCTFQSYERSDNMMAYNGYEMSPGYNYGCDGDETYELEEFVGHEATWLLHDKANELCKEWLQENIKE